MSDAGIKKGDLVFIKSQAAVENGEIAAVLIGEVVTVKRVFRNAGGLILDSENKNYQPILFIKKDRKDISILGKVTMVQSRVN